MMALTYSNDDLIFRLKNIPTQEQLIVEVLKAFTNICRVEESHFFRYSPIGFLGEGIISLKENQVQHIPEARYDVRSLPTMEAAILERKAKYYNAQQIFENTGSNYVIESTVHSFLVLPLFNGITVFGFICGINKEGEMQKGLLEELTAFGEQVGNILHSFSMVQTQPLLSNRELEVMKEISKGAATKEIAISLRISEATVKQYVKLAIKKTGAANRVHAVAELMRRGIIL